jgi:hypothetical protein
VSSFLQLGQPLASPPVNQKDDREQIRDRFGGTQKLPQRFD